MQRQEKYLEKAAMLDLGEGRDVKGRLKRGLLRESNKLKPEEWGKGRWAKFGQENLGIKYGGTLPF